MQENLVKKGLLLRLETIWINRNIFLLWAGQLISQLGDKFYSIALAWWLLEKSGSPSIMGLYLAVSMLPEMAFGPVAGVFTDRWNRKTILIATDLIRGLIVMGIAFLSWQGMLEIWHIFAATVVISLSSAFFNPTVMAVIPQMVTRDELPKANSLSQMTVGLSTIAGPVLGAFLVSFLGFNLVFLLNGLSYVTAAVFEMFLTIPQFIREQNKTFILQSLKEGLVFVGGKKNILLILIVIAITHLFFGSILVSMPFLAKSLAGTGIKNLGYLEATVGIGFIIGAIVLHQNKPGFSIGFALFSAIGTMGFSFGMTGILNKTGITAIWPYLAAVLFTGAAVSIASVNWRSLLQASVPEEMAGRVFSLATTIGDTSLPLAIMIFGFLLTRFSLSLVLMFSGISLVVLSMFFYLLFSMGQKKEA